MKIKEITEKKIIFNNGVEITYYHDQVCCETVYADFSALKDQGILNIEIDNINIELVENAGFKLNGYFIPCYNEQNGYYSSDLELIIKYDEYHQESFILNRYDTHKKFIEDRFY